MSSRAGCPFAALIWVPPAIILRRCIYVINDHRQTFILCNNTTSRLVAKWYWIMCVPQYIIAPIMGLIAAGTSTSARSSSSSSSSRSSNHDLKFIFTSIFCARVSATLLAKEIDHRYPYQRVIGTCHLMTFGPLLGWLIQNGTWNETKPSITREVSVDTICNTFLWLQLRIITICLVMDTRDVIFQLMGYPFPCYIREAAIHNKLKVKDPRAQKPVTLWSRIFGP